MKMILAAVVAFLLASPCEGAMVTVQWPKNVPQAAYHFQVLKPPTAVSQFSWGATSTKKITPLFAGSPAAGATPATVTVPDFEAKALAKSGFVVPADVINLDVRAELKAAPYDELVIFLLACGIGGHLFQWAGRAGGQYNLIVTRQMALAAFGKEPE